MDQPKNTPFRVGDWRVDPASSQIRRGEDVVRLDTRAMRLLQCLASRASAVISIDELLEEVWPGIIVTQDSVYQAVASLRRCLGDDPKQSTYIATVPRLGYRMIATVSDDGMQAPVVPVISNEVKEAIAPAKSGARKRMRLAWVAALTSVVVAMVSVYLFDNPFGDSPLAPTAEKCVGVLPFRDMTDAMDEEPFADGMTEQLIDQLSKIPGAHVPSLTSSLYFKGKQATIDDVSKKLGVAYVLEGSVRKSTNTLRITAQLTRADDGYIVWSHTYDRPTTDVLSVQSDIATQVSRAMETSFKHPYTVGNE